MTALRTTSTMAEQVTKPQKSGRTASTQRLIKWAGAVLVAAAVVSPTPALAATSTSPVTLASAAATLPTDKALSPNLGGVVFETAGAKNIGRCGGWYFWC